MVGEAALETTLETVIEVGQTDVGVGSAVTCLTMLLCCFKPIRDWWRNTTVVTKVAFIVFTDLDHSD